MKQIVDSCFFFFFFSFFFISSQGCASFLSYGPLKTIAMESCKQDISKAM